ncbi:MAG: hypothetical protein QOE36_436, partial [Gaiellaceae bacterium]|nr:hypothetical protein [Gaiellaceae bacterium]
STAGPDTSARDSCAGVCDRSRSMFVAERADDETLRSIMISLMFLHEKVDRLLDIFGEDGEEEEEADG